MYGGKAHASSQTTRKAFSESFACTVAGTKVTISLTTFTKRAPDGELLEFVRLASWCTGMPECGKLIGQGNGCPYKKAA